MTEEGTGKVECGEIESWAKHFITCLLASLLASLLACLLIQLVHPMLVSMSVSVWKT